MLFDALGGGSDMQPVTLPGTLDSLNAIREYVKAAAAAAGLERAAAYRLQLAVDEVATNIVTHGYGAAGCTGEIELTANLDDQALSIVLEDTSEAYTAHPAQPDDLPLSVDERAIGGLGLLLVARNVDTFVYERRDNRNRHSLVVRRTRE